MGPCTGKAPFGGLFWGRGSAFALVGQHQGEPAPFLGLLIQPPAQVIDGCLRVPAFPFPLGIKGLNLFKCALKFKL